MGMSSKGTASGGKEETETVKRDYLSYRSYAKRVATAVMVEMEVTMKVEVMVEMEVAM